MPSPSNCCARNVSQTAGCVHVITAYISCDVADISCDTVNILAGCAGNLNHLVVWFLDMSSLSGQKEIVRK